MAHVRKRRAPAAEEDASDVESEAPRQRRRQSATALDEDDYLHGVAEATQGGSNVQQMVKNLVRLALASEYSRTPLRRNEINAKVLGAQARQFKTVFGEAQSQLRAVFGMEMIELPLREKVTLAQRRAAQKSANAQKSSGAWVLTSILPARFREPEILPPPLMSTPETESQYIALYTFVIALILLAGGTLSENKLERHLQRAKVDETTPFADSTAHNGSSVMEKLLKRMEKESYVVKIRDTSSGEETVEWIVGPRGKVEVGERGVTGLVRTVYGDLNDEEAEELERKLERSLGLVEKKLHSGQGQAQNGEMKPRSRTKNNTQADDEEEESSDEQSS